MESEVMIRVLIAQSFAFYKNKTKYFLFKKKKNYSDKFLDCKGKSSHEDVLLIHCVV